MQEFPVENIIDEYKKCNFFKNNCLFIYVLVITKALKSNIFVYIQCCNKALCVARVWEKFNVDETLVYHAKYKHCENYYLVEKKRVYHYLLQ